MTVRPLKLVLCAAAAALVAGYAYMLHDPLARPFYIDEMIYSGQWLYHLVTYRPGFYWTIEAKQPLYFWICQTVFKFFPQSLSESPRFLLTLTRVLSAVCCTLVPLLVGLIVRPSGRRWTHWAVVVAMFLLSPFFLIHAQLGIVEPLLMAVFLWVLWATCVYLRNDSLGNLVLLSAADCAFVLIKTNALIPLLGIALTCAGYALLSQEGRPYRAAASVHAFFLTAGFLFSKAMPGVMSEAERVFQLSGLSLDRLSAQLHMHRELLAYYLPYSALLLLALLFFKSGLFTGTGKEAAGRGGFPLVACLAIAEVSFFVCSAGLKDNAPRYYLFSFLPLLIAASSVLCSILDRFEEVFHSRTVKASFLLGMAVLLGADVSSSMQIFHDNSGGNPRIHRVDKRQYYDIFAVESLRGLEDEIIAHNAEIYAFDPPYMEAMMIRSLLGVRESQKRLKPLPPTVEQINSIPCNPGFGATLLLTGNWYFTEEMRGSFKDVVRVRDYRANSPAGVNFTLYRKKCG